jgi:hypothetical protein
MDDNSIQINNDEYPLNPSEPQEMPASTLWPFTGALGVLFIFWGLITSFIFSCVGIVLLGIAILGWISDLEYE